MKFDTLGHDYNYTDLTLCLFIMTDIYSRCLRYDRILQNLNDFKNVKNKKKQ